MLTFPKPDAQKPGYLAISQAIMEAVDTGRLPANSLLPPSRELADSLGVSRDTVLRCYKHLQSIGLIESHGTRGTFVSANAKAAKPLASSNPEPIETGRLSSYGVALLELWAQPSFGPELINCGAVPKQYLPQRRWKLATQTNSETGAFEQLPYESAVLGRPELRSAMSTFLNRSRGIPCRPEEVVVFNISFSAVTLLCRLVLEPGDCIAMEDPGWHGVKDIAAYLGLEVVPIGMDGDGLSVTELSRSRKKIKMVYITPSHQEPTGLTMPLSRRKELMTWAQKNNAWIIEDDYDGIFHYGLTMPPAMKAMDTQDNVIHLASFWQTLFPITTLCFAVVPRPLLRILHLSKQSTAGLSDPVPQLALADMLDNGYLQKHTRKVEQDLSQKRRAIMYELKRVFGSRVHVPSQTGGLTMMVKFIGHSDEKLIEAASKANFELISTQSFYLRPRAQGEFLIYFAGLDESTLRQSVNSFAKYLA
jgi:GntR family transcriptional regulator/MocR family aminotransferase